MKLLAKTRMKQDFPALRRTINGHELSYLDSAATSLTPTSVIAAMNEYYTEFNANVHRGIHTMSEEASERYDEAHDKVARFVDAKFPEVIFTKNATEAINAVAYSSAWDLKKGDEIVITKMEHHSNFVPWQQIAARTGAELKFIDIKDNKIDMNDAEEKITGQTKVVAVVHASNVLGTINDVRALSKLAHDHGARCVVDACQSVPHMPVSFRDTGADFLAFSGHKMCGPTGIGVLVGRESVLEDMSPFLYGGDMIKDVSFERTVFNDLPWKFEAGTPNIAEAIGLSAAVDYLEGIGMSKVRDHGSSLAKEAIDMLQDKGAEVYGPEQPDAPDVSRTPAVSFNIDDIHPHDVSAVLNQEGIAIRGGHHCAQPLLRTLGLKSTCRASFYIYNGSEDIERLEKGIDKAREILGRGA